MNFGWIVTYADLLLWGAGQTLLLLIISVGLGFPLAIGIALLRLGQNRVLARLADGYCTFLRGTPLLVQLWLLYYGSARCFRWCRACVAASFGHC